MQQSKLAPPSKDQPFLPPRPSKEFFAAASCRHWMDLFEATGPMSTVSIASRRRHHPIPGLCQWHGNGNLFCSAKADSTLGISTLP